MLCRIFLITIFMDRVNNVIEAHESRIKEFNSIWYTDGSKTSEEVSLGVHSLFQKLSISYSQNIYLIPFFFVQIKKDNTNLYPNKK